MDALLDSIRAALTPDASGEAKATGASACRTILTALEAKPGEPLVSDPPLPPAGLNIAAAVTVLRALPPEQLLDLAIARLKAALPAGAAVAPVQPLKFHILPVQHFGARS